MHKTVELLGGPYDGAQYEVPITPSTIERDGEIYVYSRLRPSGVFEMIHISLVREGPTTP